MRRERVIAVLAPSVFLLSLELARAFVLDIMFPPELVHVVVPVLAVAGVVLFTVAIFRVLSESQTQVVEQNRQLAALDEASVVIASELTIDRVLQRIVDIARDLTGARYVALGVLGPEGDLVDLITSGLSGMDRARIGALPKSHGLLARMLRDGAAVRIADIKHAPYRSGFPPHHPAMKTLMGVPIYAGATVIGDLYLADKENGGEFSADDERLMVLLAAHAAVAIENARLHEQVQQLAVLEERDRIGRELHDGTIQSIYGVGLMLEDSEDLLEEQPEAAKRRIDEAIEGLNAIIRELRGYILNLRPQIAPDLGLIDSLERLVAQHRAHTLADVQLEVVENPSLDSRSAWQLAQVAREALSNVARHAAASQVRIRLQQVRGDVLLTIEDNGRGFDPSERGTTGQGLRNMMDRIAELNGRIEFDSKQGSGTKVRIRLPLAEKALSAEPR